MERGGAHNVPLLTGKLLAIGRDNRFFFSSVSMLQWMESYTQTHMGNADWIQWVRRRRKRRRGRAEREGEGEERGREGRRRIGRKRAGRRMVGRRRMGRRMRRRKKRRVGRRRMGKKRRKY